MHNRLAADVSRPGLLKYIEYGKYGRIFCSSNTIKNASNTENKKIIYISQYFPLRVLDRAVFPGKYCLGNTALEFPGQPWDEPMRAREGKEDRRGGGSTASNATSQRGLSGEEKQKLAGQQQKTWIRHCTRYIIYITLCTKYYNAFNGDKYEFLQIAPSWLTIM